MWSIRWKVQWWALHPNPAWSLGVLSLLLFTSVLRQDPGCTLHLFSPLSLSSLSQCTWTRIQWSWSCHERQGHTDGTFQGCAHFDFYIRNLVSWGLVYRQAVALFSQLRYIIHTEESDELPPGQGWSCTRTLDRAPPFCSPSASALKVC